MWRWLISKNLRVNERIRVKEVMVIGTEGEQLGVMPPYEAVKLAYEKDFDLVEVSPNAKPPVCKLMDYGKYKYEQNKKDKEARQKSKVVKIKEMELRPKINEHDFQTKLRNIKEFLKLDCKVKLTLFFRGREIAHIPLGQKLIDRVMQETSLLGFPEYGPKMEGKRLLLVLAPKPTDK